MITSKRWLGAGALASALVTVAAIIAGAAREFVVGYTSLGAILTHN